MGQGFIILKIKSNLAQKDEVPTQNDSFKNVPILPDVKEIGPN
jgi:hypothetical protein